MPPASAIDGSHNLEDGSTVLLTANGHHQDAVLKSGTKANGVITKESEIIDLASGTYTIPDVVLGQRRRIKVVFIGFGLTGIDFAYKAKSLPDIDFQIYEKNPAAGGTWFENT